MYNLSVRWLFDNSMVERVEIWSLNQTPGRASQVTRLLKKEVVR